MKRPQTKEAFHNDAQKLMESSLSMFSFSDRRLTDGESIVKITTSKVSYRRDFKNEDKQRRDAVQKTLKKVKTSKLVILWAQKKLR